MSTATAARRCARRRAGRDLGADVGEDRPLPGEDARLPRSSRSSGCSGSSRRSASSSRRCSSRRAIGTTGWWEVLSSPSLATLDNYREILDNEAITSADLDDALDLARCDVPPDRRRLARGLRVRLARVPGPRLALRRRRRAPRRADPDGADPDLLALQRPRAVRHDPGPRPLPHGVRAAVRDLPAPELLHRDPARPARGGADRRRLRVPDLLPA